MRGPGRFDNRLGSTDFEKKKKKKKETAQLKIKTNRTTKNEGSTMRNASDKLTKHAVQFSKTPIKIDL